MGVAMAIGRGISRGRRGLAGFLACAFVTSVSFAVVPSNVVRAATPDEIAVADGVSQFFNTLAGVDALDELGEALPFTEMLATGQSGLDVVTNVQTIAGAVALLPDKNAGAVELFLDGLDGMEIVPGSGVIVNIETSVSDSGITFETLRFVGADIEVPLGYLSGEPDDPATFSLEGGKLDVDLELTVASAGDELELDLVGGSLDIVQSSPAALTAAIELDSPSIASRLGILDVTATGSVSADLTFEVQWLDPDLSGSITQFELTNSAPADLFGVSIAAGSDVAMNLSLEAGLDGLGGVTGTITIDPAHDLSTGELPEPDLALGALGDFTNMTPQDVLAALAQVAISLRSMQLVLGNPNLPLLDENLAEFADWSDRITKLFVDKGLSLAENPIDLQIAPEVGVQCGNGVDDDGDGVADEGCPGSPSDLEAKDLASIEDIVASLATSLGDADGLGLAYQPADNSVTFSIDLTDETFVQEPPSAAFNLADELSKAGITSLQLAGGASITVTPSYDVHLTVGLDLSDALSDPGAFPITDRVFVVPAAGPELSFDAPVTGNIDLTGRISMLDLTLADDQAGDVTIVGPRLSDASNPMVSIDLIDESGDGRLTLTEIFDGMAEIGVQTTTNTVTIDAPNYDIVGTLNVGVPPITLEVDGSVAGTPLGNGSVTFAWPDLTSGEPTVETFGDFNDDFLSFAVDPENPAALFTTVLTAIDTALNLVEDISGDDVDREIPVLGTSLTELMSWVDGVQDAVNALASDPAASLELLELTIESAIAEALDELDGVDDFQVPSVPDPADPVYSPGGEFDLDAYQTDVMNYISELTAFVTANGDFVTLGYVPGTSPGALTVNLDIGVCSAKADFPGCTFEFPIEKDFNFDLSDVAGSDIGGIVGGEGQGSLAIDYHVEARVHLGVELPVVTPDDGDPDSLPQVTGSPRVFLADTSGISASVAGVLENAEFSASIGPFGVQVGELDAVAESGAECDPGNTDDDDGDGAVNDGCDALPNPETGADCTNDTDDDGDGSINDGCPANGAAETGADCANDTDDDGDSDVNDGCDTAGPAEAETACDDAVDDDGDGLVNDGCDPQGNPLVARAGAGFEIVNEGVNAGTGNDRFYLSPQGSEQDLADFFTGVTPSLTPAPGTDCPGDATPGTADYLCAHLPIYADVGGDLTFLGNLDVTAPNFDLSGTTLTGDDVILANLQSVAEGFVWDLVGEGIKQFGDAVDDGLSAAAYDVQVPVIGDLLDAGADVGDTFNTKLAQPVGDLVTELGGAGSFEVIRDEVRDYFWDNLGGAEAAASDRFILNYDSPADAPVREEDVIVTLLCGPAPGEDCFTLNPDDTPKYTDILELRDLQVQLAIGQAAAATTPDFDWGVPGLRLEGDGTLSGTVTWQVSLGFGVSLDDGFYLLGDTVVNDLVDDKDIAVTASVDFGTEGADITSDSPALEGDLAFLSAALWNAKDDRTDPGVAGDDGREAHEISIVLGVDFTDADRVGLAQLPSMLNPTSWDVGMSGYVDFYATLATTAAVAGGASEGVIPRLLADLSLTWSFDATLNDGFQQGDLAAGFDNIQLDLGSFLSEFLDPVLGEVQRYTKPLQPIIDTLQAPVPGVSQLAELVGADPITLLDLMEGVSGADLTLIRRLLDVISFANSIPTGLSPGDPSLIIPIGEFLLEPSQLMKPELPSTSKADLINEGSKLLDGGVSGGGGVLGQLKSKSGSSSFNSQVDKATSNDGGFSFPAFQEPTKLFNLLVGEDVELIEFDAGTLKAEVGWSQSFGPIAVGPIPVSVVVSLTAAVEGRFVIGYDTRGIRQLVQNLTDDDNDNDAFFESVGTLFAGVYLGDLADDGSDPPEIRLTLEGAVGAAVDLVIIKAGIEAGLRATLDLNLHDGGFLNPVPPENLDGKLRIDEIITFINNPLCLFDVSGRLEAFIRIFVTIDLFLFSVTYKQTIVNIVLLELENITAELCQPPEPEPATNDDGTLVLNVGPRAGLRNYDVNEPDEKIVVKQLTDGVPADIEVSYKGYTETYEAVSKIVGDGGPGDDTFVIEDGDISGVCQPDGTVNPPVPGWEESPGDGGLDCLEEDNNVDDTVTYLVNFVVPLHLCGGPGADKIGGGDGADKLIGHGEIAADLSTCDPGADADGAGDTDTISSEAGNDDIWGNGGDDILEGGSDDDEIWGGNGFDELVGGLGADELHGGLDGDNLSGGPEADPCEGDDRDLCSDAADDILNGGGGDDALEGGHGKDEMNGGPGNDTLVGGLGDDEMNGDGDTDSLFGNEGNDDIDGGSGDDDAYGAEGDDLINGGADDDDLVGEEGIDTINGGSGRDVILGDMGVINRDPDPAGSSFTPSPDKQLVELDNSTVPPAAGDNINGGPNPDRIWGQEGDDDIAGDGGDDIIRGNAGNDTIWGNAGADELFGDDGMDEIFGDAPAAIGATDGIDVIRGGNDDDVISGNAQGDRLFGDSGHDTIYGDADAEVCADDGNDFIVAGSGNDLVFGNSADDDIFGEGGIDRLVGGSNTAGVCDGDDDISGGRQGDVIAGDNATIGDGPVQDHMLVTLLLDGEGAGDHDLDGDDGDDRIFGQVGDDTINGGTGNDYVEGNEAADTISGNEGADDLIGGSSANDGATAVIDDDRTGDGRADGIDTIDGDDTGQAFVDWIAGDNALVSRNSPATGRAPIHLFDVHLVDPVQVPVPGTSAGDTINGGGADDLIFGQGGADTLHGDGGDDYVEGNHDDDSIFGDAGDDDLVGGGSANDGQIVPNRVGDGLADVGELLISGGQGVDWITGDNALVDRNLDAGAPAPVRLFDVETVTTSSLPGTGGGEVLIDGGSGDDLIFGQTGGDTIDGSLDDDYIEGNNGEDVIDGGSGLDDLVGGGSADDGIIDDDRVGDGLLDDGDAITGGPDEDWAAGDNALINRNVAAAGRAPIELFDVEVYDYATQTALTSPLTGGPDVITGDGGPDRLFGQTDDDDLSGGDGTDYIEGNNGVDSIDGGSADDDLIGGGSATDGVIDGERTGNRLLDLGENVVIGGSGNDWIAGDNALLNRIVPAVNGPSGTLRAPIELFDVQTSTGIVIAGDVSGGDLLQGNDGFDRIFGQGNGFQPADQTDPVDGRNNDYNGAAEADGDFDRLAGTADEDGAHQAGWLGDTILGGDDDDEIEGNHGNDLIYGNGDEDDIAGGGSADDGKIWDTMRLANGAHLLDGADIVHGDDADATLGDHDAIVGDNGWVGRTGVIWAGTGPDGVAFSLTDRLVGMTDSKPDDGTSGDDYIAGNGGHDELYGQAGDDMVEGEWGSDAVVGDLGFVDTELLGDGDGANVLCGQPDFIEPKEPFVGEDVCEDGTLFRRVLLFAYDDAEANAVEGADVMIGGDGDDWMHGGAGADLIQGDGDGGVEITDPDADYTTTVVDPNPASADKDRIFGGDSNGRGTVDASLGGDGDAIWGGRGNDYLFGGHGDDMMDVRPDGVFSATWSAWAEADIESYHGVDIGYGGWDQDAMQANVAANGPVVGDRMLDWVGVYNITYLCPATYGAYVTIRDQSPHMIQWVIDLADASGAVDPGNVDASGGDEVAMVYKPDVKSNANPIYPGTPGHFTCSP